MLRQGQTGSNCNCQHVQGILICHSCSMRHIRWNITTPAGHRSLYMGKGFEAGGSVCSLHVSCRSDNLDMYEELYFNITSNSTGVAYNLTRPPIPWNYTQCAIADSQFFWAGLSFALPGLPACFALFAMLCLLCFACFAVLVCSVACLCCFACLLCLLCFALPALHALLCCACRPTVRSVTHQYLHIR